MPPRRRIAKLRRRTIDDSHLAQLLSGNAFFRAQWDPLTDEELRALWEEYRDELMALWRNPPEDERGARGPARTAALKAVPGHRPWAWWEFDAPEPVVYVRHAYRGLYERPDREGYITRETPDGRVRERQVDYLKRHGLIDADELARAPGWTPDWEERAGPEDPRDILKGYEQHLTPKRSA